MPRRRRRSGQRSRQARMERRQARHVASQRDPTTGEMVTTPTGERAVPKPQFPLSMRNTAMAYASSASTDVAARGGRPSRHVPAARILTATTNDESYHGSASELLLTDKRRIPLRSASVRTPHLFHHGIPKVLVNPRSKGITSVRSTFTL
jgi:hypothetical protein